MVIREMTREECLGVLAGARLARLACAHENQPYVVPVYLAYYRPPSGKACLYGFTTPGQKVAWMRANPLVCVEVDKVADFDRWVSVIAFGHYEELRDKPGNKDARLRAQESQPLAAEAVVARTANGSQRLYDDEAERAWQVLKTDPAWEEPGLTAWAGRAHRNSAEPFIAVYYRIRIDRVTGHEATPDAKDSISKAVPAAPAG
jgi:hypothetical protein